MPFDVLGFIKTLDRHLKNTGTSGSWAQKYDKLLYVFRKLRQLVQALLSRKEGNIIIKMSYFSEKNKTNYQIKI